MGTYDTIGGTPRSPDEEEPYIFPEEEKVLEILEAANVPSAVNDKVVEIVAAVCRQASEVTEALNEAKKTIEGYKAWERSVNEALNMGNKVIITILKSPTSMQ